jgi:hypothetical protein
MFEVQADQFATISYSFTDDSGELVDVHSMQVTSSDDTLLEVVPEAKTDIGVYAYRLNHKGIGVGTVDMTAEKVPGDAEPFTDQEAFSTIPNLAEGFGKTVLVSEL